MATNKYKKAKIYRLVNEVDGEFYVGSTCTSLARRLSSHRGMAKVKPNQKVYKHLNSIGFDKVSIILVEEYSCENKMQLETRERKHIEELKPTLNSSIPTRTRAEFNEANRDKMKQYYQDNRNTIINRAKQYLRDNPEKAIENRNRYVENNQEKVSETNAKYYENNKAKLLEAMATKVKCECGCEVSKGNMSKHIATTKHTKRMNKN